MDAALSNAFSMFFESQQSKLGYLYLDVLVSEQLTLPSDVTKYPIEDGNGDISDHITMNNEEIQISGMISAATSFGMEFGSKCYSKMIDAVDQMRKMHKERKEVTVVTGLGQYENFGFTALTIQRQSSADAGGPSITINATLRKVKKVVKEKCDLPPDHPEAERLETEKKSGFSGKGADALSPVSAALSGGSKAALLVHRSTIHKLCLHQNRYWQLTKMALVLEVKRLKQTAIEAVLDDTCFISF